ncbi:MAG: hypothetical protein ABFS10_12025 [Bacteroidota bacterium]
MKTLFQSIRTAVIAGLLGLILVPFLNAQSQQGFSYQAVARNQSGEALANQELTVRIAIRADSQGGELIWQEEHDKVTNSQGLFTLQVGDPGALNKSGSVTSFNQIDWSAHAYFLNVWIKTTGDFIDMGGSPIATVPIAQYATSAENATSAETATHAQSAVTAETATTAETADFATTAGSANSATTAESATTAASATTADMAATAESATTAISGAGNFIIQADAGTQSGEALFEVKRADGQPVFAVYDSMVWVYADPAATKGKKGGFAVGGFSNTKGVTEEYLRVTGDSVRVYVSEDPVKGVKGGFAVGGISKTTKGPAQEFLRVTPDSVRVYIGSDDGTKGVKGGFAVGGFSNTKGAAEDLYTFVSGNNAVDVVEETSQLMWYPLKEAFLSGNIHIGSVDSVGQNSTAMGYKSIAMGDYSQAFGYRSQSLGNYSTSFGNRSIASGEDSYALGSGAVASGEQSFAIGVGSTATGLSSMGLGTKSNALNHYSTAIGYYSTASGLFSHSFGLFSSATADRSMALGMAARATGYESLAIGASAHAYADTAISLGSDSEASGIASVAIGTGSLATGKLATSIGYNTRAEGFKSISVGSYYYWQLFFPIIIFPPIIVPPKGGDTELELIKEEPPSKAGSFVSLPLYADRDNTALDTYSMALGNGNLADQGGIAVGVFNDATEIYATAIGFGNQAVAPYSFAGGIANKTEGNYATAFGHYTSAPSFNSFVIGTYNKSVGTSDDWIPTDPLFQIGNGTGRDLADQHDAFRVDKNGGTTIYPQNAYSGLYVYGVNSTYNMRTYNRIEADNTANTIYGLYSRVYSLDTDVTSIYSGFFNSNRNGYAEYKGLYADLRSGGGIDVAEYINDTHGDTEAGDVLVADPAKDESVLRSAKPYQTSVLGVVTTKPHMVMGMELVVDEETGEPIPGVLATRLALTGRVPVKITEENGSIEPGDLLTTSSTPGHAMKWTLLDVNEAKDFEELKSMLAENERRRNAVIGKAVSSSGSGTGTVVVLISLQ